MSSVSINDSLVALRKWGDDANTCAQDLDRISRKAGALADAIKALADTVRDLGHTLSQSHRIIRDHYVNDNKSAIINKLKNASVLDSLPSLCEWAISGVEKLKRRVYDERERPSSMTKQLRWFWDQVKRRDICLLIRRIQKSLQIIMSQVTYERCQQRALKPSSQERELCDFNKEMKDCRKDIGLYIKAVDILKERQESLHHKRSHTHNEFRLTRISRVEDAILEIWDAILREASERESSLGSCGSTTGELDAASMKACIFQPNGTLQGEGGKNNAEQRDCNPRSTATVRDPTMYWPPQPRSHRESPDFILSQPPEIYPEPVLSQRDTSPVLAELVASNLEYSMLDHNDAPAEKEVLLDEEDYSAVQPFERIICLDPKLNVEASEGYINSNSKPTSAVLNSEFPQNVISERYAAAFGLAIKYSLTHDGDESDSDSLDVDIEQRVDFGNDKSFSVIGKTAFQWKISQHAADSVIFRPITVRCFVTRAVPFDSPLVLGRSFIDKRKHYWKR